MLSGVCADYIIHCRYLSVANTRKLFVILNIGVTGVCFVVLAYAGDNIVTFMIFLTIAFCALGFNGASILPNPMDISKTYSGIIVGMMVTTGGCAGFIGPLILALIIENDNTFERWSSMFMITAAVEFFGMVFFLIFAKGQKQEWSEIDTRQNEEMRALVNK
ncbi:sialin-like [Anneissia japonica]|uniref:sialin-like n=1 Tax=Anneissia japonica TaxID=1529436 RepID=UPI0014254CD8|nr:sialin-like [Anneissia japonica]